MALPASDVEVLVELHKLDPLAFAQIMVGAQLRLDHARRLVFDDLQAQVADMRRRLERIERHTRAATAPDAPTGVGTRSGSAPS